VPVKSRSGDVLGGLFFGYAKTAMFSERSESGLAGVAAEAAVVLENARLEVAHGSRI
jgi:GAF domain-containing protein